MGISPSRSSGWGPWDPALDKIGTESHLDSSIINVIFLNLFLALKKKLELGTLMLIIIIFKDVLQISVEDGVEIFLL